MTQQLRKCLSYLNWLYNPFHRLDASGIYDLLSTSSPTQQALYLNLGYWPAAANFDEASVALAMLVGKTAQLSSADIVLDCGFGFGDQDILWTQKLAPTRIIGLNNNASQVALARQRVAATGLNDRIDLQLGSATRMPAESGSVDKVIALECAFHFNTREHFFGEAWRVLRPGGRLVTADIIPMPPAGDLTLRRTQRRSWNMVARRFAIPKENTYSSLVYHTKLAVNGFDQIAVKSIRNDVYAPMHRFLRNHPQTLKRLHPMARLPARLVLRCEAASFYAGLDYVLATGVKPNSGGT